MSAGHWDDVYSSKSAESLSWFQSDPQPSLGLLAGAHSVIDVGSGASTLVDSLIGLGVQVTCLDVSAAALALTRERLGDAGSRVDFRCADVTHFEPDRVWDAWHDRAVFHFLTQRTDQDAYARTAHRSVAAGGRLVLGCFSPSGPQQCSGLDVARHEPEEIAEVFKGFTIEQSFQQTHTTPWGAQQDFLWTLMHRD